METYLCSCSACRSRLGPKYITRRTLKLHTNADKLRLTDSNKSRLTANEQKELLEGILANEAQTNCQIH